MFELNGKKAIVTGAGSGIGQATALILSKQGAAVYGVDLNEENLRSMIHESEGRIQPVICDVTNQSNVKEQFSRVGKIDILVNCAGISNIGTATTTSEEDFVKVFNVNVKGIYNCLHEGIPLMQQNGSGVIINMTSVANHSGIADRFAYSMTKGAVDSMTLSVAKDYIKENIRCNSVSPARVHTPFVDGYLKKTYPGREEEMYKKLEATQPIGRMGKPEEIGALILYLCSDEASFITGSDFPIDGGFVKLNS